MEQERSIEELRRDINRKAKYLYFTVKKSDWIAIVTLVAVFLGLLALNRHLDWEINGWIIAAAIGVIALGAAIIHKINKHYFNLMKCTVDAAQYIKAVKGLKRATQAQSIFAFCSGILMYQVTVHSNEVLFVIPLFLFFIIASMIWLHFKPNAFVDKELCNDIDELEEYQLNN